MVRVLFLLPMLLPACYTQIDRSTDALPFLPTRTAPEFHAILPEPSGQVVFPDSGYYYELDFPDFPDASDDVPGILSDLYSRGFNITRAWFRPRGMRGSTVISQLLILNLSNRYDEYYRFGFRPIPAPPSPWGGKVALFIYTPRK